MQPGAQLNVIAVGLIAEHRSAPHLPGGRPGDQLGPEHRLGRKLDRFVTHETSHRTRWHRVERRP